MSDFEHPEGSPADPDTIAFLEHIAQTQGGGANPNPTPVLDDKFDPSVADDVVGLLQLGRLTKSYEVYGHRVVLKTLTTEEELAVGQIIDEYGGSFMQGKAATAAYVAASLVTIDGDEVARSLQADASARVRAKYVKVIEWDFVVVDAIYRHLTELLGRKAAAFQEVEGKSSASRNTSTS